MTRGSTTGVALAGKLSPPRLGRVFDRERLFGLLDGRSTCPALWVGAAPGAGKSTLVATWLQRQAQRIGRRTLWMQVDPGDADPATFLQSLDALLLGAASEAVTPPAFRADDLTDLAGWLRRRLRLFMPHLPPSWVLVFDNHQELPADSPLQATLARAIGELPPAVQWIFISRERPPAAYAAALARQQLVVLDAESLRFDAEEALALARLHGCPEEMTAQMAEALSAAEGWAGGMTLMLLGSPRAVRVPGIEARQRLFEYFAGEVLAGMPTAEREALCAIAYLPGATAGAALAVSGLAQAPALLERLAATSLFTDRREGPAQVFVFHSLFSDFLRRHYESTHSAGEVQALLRRAGEVLLSEGQLDAGLQRLLDGACWDEAAATLLVAAPRLVDEGRLQALLRFIERLPARLHDDFGYWRAFCLLDSEPESALPLLAQARERAARSGDADGELLACAAAATALVATGRITELDPWLAVLDRQHASAALVMPEEIEMRLVPGLLAAVVFRAPWNALAEPLAERAERLLHRDAAAGQRLLLGSLAYHLLWRGHVDRLERIVARIDALCARQLAAPATMMRWWGVGILVKTLLGQIGSARDDAERAIALVEVEPSVVAQGAAVHLLRMIVALAASDAVAARRSMGAAAQALHPDNAVDRAMLEHQRGMLALLEDDRATALRLMRASVASAQQGGFPMREHIALIANALAAARSDEHDEAQRLLQAVFAHPFHAICRWHHWVAGMVATYAARRGGDGALALARLRAALAVARECGFRQGPMLYCCGDMMAELAALALAHGIEPDVARDLVLRHDLPAPAIADAAWPWAVRLHAFGPLAIERADGPLPTGRKESRRLLELAALVAAHGASPVPLETLADELWPDAEGDAARNALDNAVHRLRKLLGGDDRLLIRQGALALNPQRCWTDVAAVEATLAALDGADGAAAPALVTSLCALYRAPLLPGETLPGVVARRRALHQRVWRGLQGAAERLAAAGMRAESAAAAAAAAALPEP